MNRKKVCLFGIFDPNYSRNRVLRSGFERLGYEVVLCRVDPEPGLKKYINLFKKGFKSRSEQYEHIIVAFPGHSVVWVAYLIWGRKIIFDAFLSLYNSNAEDRKVYSKWSFGAFKDWFLDFHATQLASLVLIDTNEHIKYFSRNFFLNPSKCIRVLIGADDEVFKPTNFVDKEEGFIVHFHGNFIPLQGISYIVDAVNCLRDIKDMKFSIIGDGSTYETIKNKIEKLSLEDNITLHGKVPIEEVARRMARAHVVLGIFGDTNKTDMVIPNKVYESIAQGKPTISAETSAIREVFSNKKDIILCQKADGKDLARVIKLLYNDPVLRRRVSVGARDTFSRHCTPEVIVSSLINDVKKRRKK